MKFVLFLLWFSFLLASCDLLDSPNPSSNEQDTPDSPFLLTQIDYLYDPPKARFQFLYDDQSRLIKSINHGYIHSLYKYNAKNQVEIVNTFFTHYNGDTTNHYSNKKYTYNNQGKWVKCVIEMGDTTHYATMSYSLNKETMNYYIENNKLGSTVTYEYKDGNVVKSTHEYFGDYPAVIVISYEFADMDNLLVTLDKLLDYQFNGSNRANIYSTPHTQSKKLLTKITYIHSRPEYSSSAEYSYDFNSNGLPTKVYKATFEYPSNSNLGTSNEAYEYIMR